MTQADMVKRVQGRVPQSLIDKIGAPPNGDGGWYAYGVSEAVAVHSLYRPLRVMVDATYPSEGVLLPGYVVGFTEIKSVELSPGSYYPRRWIGLDRISLVTENNETRMVVSGLDTGTALAVTTTQPHADVSTIAVSDHAAFVELVAALLFEIIADALALNRNQRVSAEGVDYTRQRDVYTEIAKRHRERYHTMTNTKEVRLSPAVVILPLNHRTGLYGDRG